MTTTRAAFVFLLLASCSNDPAGAGGEGGASESTSGSPGVGPTSGANGTTSGSGAKAASSSGNGNGSGNGSAASGMPTSTQATVTTGNTTAAGVFNGALDDLPGGTWMEIPNTKMRDVCPPDAPDYAFSDYCYAVIAAWGGAAADTTNSRMVLWGGGHGDYKGNEVYIFDVMSLLWSRPWGPSAADAIPSGGTHEVYDDGNPGSRHTYSGLVYVPPPLDRMVALGGALWQSGSFATGTWSFSFAQNAWTRLADGPAEQGFGDPSVLDPTTGHIFRRTNSRMVEVDPATGTFTDRADSNGGFWMSNVSTALDPVSRKMVMMGDGRVDIYDIGSDTYQQDVPTSGTPAMDGSPGLSFDETRGVFVVWTGGTTIYTFDPATGVFTQVATAGVGATEVASGGVFGRFRYFPSRDVHIGISSVDENVFAFRMP